MIWNVAHELSRWVSVGLVSYRHEIFRAWRLRRFVIENISIRSSFVIDYSWIKTVWLRVLIRWKWRKRWLDRIVRILFLKILFLPLVIYLLFLSLLNSFLNLFIKLLSLRALEISLSEFFLIELLPLISVIEFFVWCRCLFLFAMNLNKSWVGFLSLSIYLSSEIKLPFDFRLDIWQCILTLLAPFFPSLLLLELFINFFIILLFGLISTSIPS